MLASVPIANAIIVGTITYASGRDNAEKCSAAASTTDVGQKM